MIKTLNSYIPSENDLASTIGFGLNSQKSYIIFTQPGGSSGGPVGCTNGIPYGILLSITQPCPVFSPPAEVRGCTSGIPLGLLLSITCGP
jgi:hypothetical protein